MKSIFISVVIFLVLLLAIEGKLFDVLSSRPMYYFGLCCIIVVFFVAFKVLGNPFKENKKNGQN